MHRILSAVILLSLLCTLARAQQSQNPQATARTLQRLATLMDRDWKEKPEWAQMATAILRRRFNDPGAGWWKPGESRYDWHRLAEHFDANKSRVIEEEEVGKLTKYFQLLDQNRDGQITRSDLMERPQPRTREAMMANELFNRFDNDNNGKLTKEEVLKFFDSSDRGKLGFLTLQELTDGLRPQLPSMLIDSGKKKPEYQPGRDMMADLDMLLSGQMGSLTEGPKLNAEAPDFTLKLRDSDKEVTLSKLRGRPVVLIFGSFT